MQSKKIACYTCITGGYESIKPVLHPDPDVDYLLFSNRPILACAPWRTIVLDLDGLDNKDVNRTVKLRPHLVPELTAYDICVYIDGHIQVIGSISNFVKKYFDVNADVYLFRHPYRKTLNEEMRACAWFGHSWFWILYRQYYRYKKEGFPDNTGLFEAGVIIWRNTTKAREFGEFWWNEYRRDSMRDQMALPFAIWKISPRIGNLGFNNIRGNSPYFLLLPHKHGFRWISKLRRLFNFPLWLFSLNNLRYPEKQKNDE